MSYGDPSCDNCIFGLYKDVGYSDWTVLGTDFYCRLGKREMTSAETYETIEKPDDCDEFRSGQPTKLSVSDKLPDDLKRYQPW
jgi:hypothetical protein